MEKRTPHCRLAVVKNLVAAGKVRTTVSALAGGAALGFGFVYLKLTVLDDVLIVSFKEL